MKRVKKIIAGLILLNSVWGISAPKNWYDSASIRIDSLRKANFVLQILDKNGQPVSDSIKIKLFKHKFTFGVVMDPESSPGSDSWDRATMYRYYNGAVSGNCFKWSGIEANRGVLTYAGFDSILAWCERVGWRLKGHTLLWNGHAGNYHEVPKWVQDLPTAQEANEACKTRVIREVTRYKGRVFEYDVMNEPSHTFYLTNKIGDSINWNCFKWARQADSTAELFMNDYNTIEWDEYQPFINIVRKCLDNGAPITGIGIQAHFGGSIITNDVKRRLDKLATLGLPMRITEFDMNVTENNVTPINQAMYYARMLRIAFSYPKITGFYFWGLIDGKVWRAGSGIFAVNKTPKPAADSVYNLIHKEWTTDVTGLTDNEGKILFRGFYGDYHIFAKINGVWKEFRISCTQKQKDSTLILREEDGMVPRPRLIKGKVVSPRTVELTFDKKMADPQNNYASFEVYAKVKYPVLSAKLKEGDSSTIVLTVKYDIAFNHYVVAAYMNPYGKQTAADSSKLDIFGATPMENLLPGIVSANTTTDGSQIIIRFNKEMTDPAAYTDSMKILVNMQKVAVQQIKLRNDSNNVLEIQLVNPISSGDVVYFNYTTAGWTTTEGIELPSTGNVLVTNMVPNNVNTTNANEVYVYPNPVKDFATLYFASEYQKITIYNVLGKEVISFTNVKSPQVIDLSKFNSGIYFVKLFDNSGKNTRLLKINKL